MACGWSSLPFGEQWEAVAGSVASSALFIREFVFPFHALINC